MSTKIRVSYERESELVSVIASLGKRVRHVQREPAKGRFQRAYIEVADLPGEPAFTRCKAHIAPLAEQAET